MKLIQAVIVFLLGVISAKLFFEHYHLYNFKVLDVHQLHYTDGSEYQGTTENRKPHGQGIQTWPNGDRYEGEFFEGYMQGYGHFIYADGDIYKGQMKEGAMTGKGELTFNGGNFYKGGFLDGNFHGHGYLKSSSETEYSGNFEQDHYQGQGTLKNSNGDIYTGKFEKSVFQGQGSYSMASKDKYIGQFEAGNLNGEGIHISYNGSKYEGEFVDWMYHGQGKYTAPSGNVYKGEFEYGAFAGEGHYTFEDGEYVGKFSQGKYHGEGKLTYKDGRNYQGDFKNGFAHGLGVFIDTDGKEYQGLWNKGQLLDADKPISIEVSFNDSELILQNHQKKLDQSLENLVEGVQGKREFYNVLVAGDGSQSVFEKEVNTIAGYLEPQRTIKLINQKVFSNDYPIASNSSLKEVLLALEEKMNLEEDVLFLYMTSHGSDDGYFYVKKENIKLASIHHKQIAALLAESKIKNKIIFLSSCYSGALVDEIKGASTLVITSSASDKTSFGCSNDSEMTWFAKAFFDNQSSSTIDLKKRFYQAKEKVLQWELEENYTLSEPQISIGKNAITSMPLYQGK